MKYFDKNSKRKVFFPKYVWINKLTRAHSKIFKNRNVEAVVIRSSMLFFKKQ